VIGGGITKSVKLKLSSAARQRLVSSSISATQTAKSTVVVGTSTSRTKALSIRA
jgi:hypothetical protein